MHESKPCTLDENVPHAASTYLAIDIPRRSGQNLWDGGLVGHASRRNLKRSLLRANGVLVQRPVVASAFAGNVTKEHAGDADGAI